MVKSLGISKERKEKLSEVCKGLLSTKEKLVPQPSYLRRSGFPEKEYLWIRSVGEVETLHHSIHWCELVCQLLGKITKGRNSYEMTVIKGKIHNSLTYSYVKGSYFQHPIDTLYEEYKKTLL